MKKILGRILVVLPAIALQIIWYIIILSDLNKLMNGHLRDIIGTVLFIIAVLIVLGLVSKRDEGSYKLVWIIVILIMPILGAIIYLFMGNKRSGKRLKKRLKKASGMISIMDVVGEKDCVNEIVKDDLRLSQTLRHITGATGFPVFKIDTSRYYCFGEEMFADMVRDLKTAEHYIYMEYFIIQHGKFWDTLTDILAERAAAGVDVRILYDDLGSISKYSYADILDLKRKGIKCISFNPLLFISARLNNRDHRKITVVDGRIAFSGGLNMADEYINEIHPYGIWKDIGFRITGPAVRSYTYMFVEFWNAFSADTMLKEHLTFPDTGVDTENPGCGYILPYYDSPVRDEHISNFLFSDILYQATGYVWFYTPYLMLGDTLLEAVVRAAQRGVDVRIIVPRVSDSKFVQRIARSYYRELINGGARIYEYKPGFIHAKAFLADDKVAGIGTVNMDYRSLFLHFECESVFYKADIIETLKNDYQKTLEDCEEETAENISNSIFCRLLDSTLRLVAPLM